MVLLVGSSVATATDQQCEIDANCKVTGTLIIYRTPPEFTAVVQLGSRCVSLALPEYLYAESDSWNGRTVTVSGLSIAHRTSTGIVSYEVDGRYLTAICSSPYAIFVDGIALAE